MRLKKIGIIGTGKIAIDHASAAKDLGATIVSGSCSSERSRNWKKFKTKYPQAVYEPDSKKLLNDPNIDGLISCLPYNIQAEWAESLLSSSKPILIEKPLALEKENISNLLSNKELYLKNKLIGYNRRYYKTVDILKKRVSKGGLRSAEIVISEGVKKLVERRGKNILQYILETSSSCHILDIANYVFGELKVVKSYSNYSYSNQNKYYLSFNGILENKEKKPIFYTINSEDPSKVGISCRFDDCTKWDLKPIERLTVFKGYNIKERTPLRQVKEYQPNVIENVIEDSKFNPGFSKQMEAFLCGKYGPGANILDTLNLLELISQIKKTS